MTAPPAKPPRWALQHTQDGHSNTAAKAIISDLKGMMDALLHYTCVKAFTALETATAAAAVCSRLAGLPWPHVSCAAGALHQCAAHWRVMQAAMRVQVSPGKFFIFSHTTACRKGHT